MAWTPLDMIDSVFYRTTDPNRIAILINVYFDKTVGYKAVVTLCHYIKVGSTITSVKPVNSFKNHRLVVLTQSDLKLSKNGLYRRYKAKDSKYTNRSFLYSICKEDIDKLLKDNELTLREDETIREAMLSDND